MVIGYGTTDDGFATAYSDGIYSVTTHSQLEMGGDGKLKVKHGYTYLTETPFNFRFTAFQSADGTITRVDNPS